MLKEMEYYDELGVSPMATANEIKIQDEADTPQLDAYGKSGILRKEDFEPSSMEDIVSFNWEEFQKMQIKYEADGPQLDAYGKAGISRKKPSIRSFYREKFQKLQIQDEADTKFQKQHIQDEAESPHLQPYSGIFEEYIGQLTMLYVASLKVSIEGEEFDRGEFREKLQTFKKKREKKLAGILKDRLNLYVQGNKEEFIRCAEAQVSRLSNVPYGVDLLSTVGYIYASEAAQELGKNVMYLGVPFVAEWLRNAGHTVKSQFIAVKSEWSLLLLATDIERRRNGEGNYTEEEQEEYIQSHKKVLTDHLWKSNVVEIEDTLSHVCQMVLQDNNAKKEELRLRAEGLEILGKIFQKVLVCEWECSTTSLGVAGVTKNLRKLD